MSDDALHKHRHFVNEIEQAIRLANREVLHPVVNGMTNDDVVAVAIEVAKRRSAYLKATLELGHSAGESRLVTSWPRSGSITKKVGTRLPS